ncbi:MAG TPA: glycoside hydrolase family 99-like domain-containing protein [Verrucomicrobiae bacterium]|nr:glycoside hydrolase family 99-like domain-containing protein [Verrucomicrobiae bacterium]
MQTPASLRTLSVGPALARYRRIRTAALLAAALAVAHCATAAPSVFHYPLKGEYPLNGALNANRGTIELLFKPETWDGTERNVNRFLFTVNGNVQYGGGQFTVAKWWDRSSLMIRLFNWEAGAINTSNWKRGKWHSIAVTWSNGTAKCYADNVLASTRSYTPATLTSDKYIVGLDNTWRQPSGGTIGEVIFSDYVKPYPLPKPSTAGDGIWQQGETLYNCPEDANGYSISPPEDLDVVYNTAGYTVGTYVYPGWSARPGKDIYAIWNPIRYATNYVNGPGQDQDVPKKPLQNYYSDTNPIAVDWMLKWGLENGVSLYVYDWYWLDVAGISLQQSLENCFLKSKYLAKYPNNIHFAVMWCNHANYYGTETSPAIKNLRNMMSYAIQNYFSKPQYHRIGGKPVWIIWDYARMPGYKTVTGPSNPSRVIDGDKSTSHYAESGSGTRAATIHLGKLYASVDKVKIWHYYADHRKYHNMKTEVSKDGKNWYTVFDGAVSGEYQETAEGKTITFPSRAVRYVRDTISGSTANPWNHWVEIEVWGYDEDGNYVNITRKDEVGDLLAYWNQQAKSAGYPGIYFVSVYKDGSRRNIPGLTAYNYIGSCAIDRTAEGVRYTTYTNFCSTFESKWQADYGVNTNYIPIVSPGWDTTSWHGTNGTAVINGDPEKFGQMLSKAKAFCDGKGLRTILNEAWDEWGEGAVLAPTERWGTGYLGAVRKVFAPSTPTTPQKIAAKAISPTAVSIIWRPSADNVAVVGYRVFRNDVLIGSTASASFGDTGAKPNMVYSYRVTAYDGDGNVSGLSPMAVVIMPSGAASKAALPLGAVAAPTVKTDEKVSEAKTASADGTNGVASAGSPMGDGALMLAPASDVPVPGFGAPGHGVGGAHRSRLEWVPEMAVEGAAGAGIPDGGTRDFGGLLPGASRRLTFTIRNTGPADLTGLGVSIDGADADTFTVSVGPSASVPPLASTEFSVRFAPTDAGDKAAELHIASDDDPGKHPYDISLIGMGLTAQEAWQLRHFGIGVDSGDADSPADPDPDGIPNLLEFGFGTDRR